MSLFKRTSVLLVSSFEKTSIKNVNANIIECGQADDQVVVDEKAYLSNDLEDIHPKVVLYIY